MAGNFDRKLRLPRIHFRVLLHAANMRHETNGFTSLPKEGVLRIFSPWKIWVLNPRTWLPKASTLPLDHRSRLITFYLHTKLQKPGSSCILVMTVKPENCRNFSDNRHLGMLHYTKNITVTKGGYFLKFVAVQLLKILKQLALLSVPPYRYAHFAMALLDRGKLEFMMLMCSFITGRIPDFIKFGILLRKFTWGDTQTHTHTHTHARKGMLV